MKLAAVRAKYASLAPELTERTRRYWAATEALAFGHGGIGLVAQATGLARYTTSRGLREVRSGERLELGRIRRPGGGRTPTARKDPKLVADLEALVEPTAAGRPQSPVRWTSRSTRRLARELQTLGHNVSSHLVADLPRAAGYSLQLNQKTREGTDHPSGPGCPVPVPECRGGPPPAPSPAGDLSGYEEEGAGGGLQERRTRVAPTGRARAGSGPRPPHSPEGEGNPLRGVSRTPLDLDIYDP